MDTQIEGQGTPVVAGAVVEKAVAGSKSGRNSAEGKVREDQLLYLLPDEIVFPESLDVRPWSKKLGLTEEESEEIQKLADTIAEEGQIDPIKVMMGEKQEYVALTGSRRVAAITLINAGKGKKEAPLRVKAVLAEEPIKQAHAFRQAAISNIQRRSLSPMDLAACISVVKENVRGFGKTDKLAEYFAVSRATITQHLRLLELPEDMQIKVHKGELSRDAAFSLLDVKPEKRAEVLAEAEAKQKQAEASTGQSTPPTAPTSTPATKKRARNTGTVQASTVRAAVRETEGATDRPQPRTKKEIVEWAESSQGPVYGYANGSIHKWLAAFVKWAAGELSDRTMEAYFKTMVEKADRGKAEPKAKEEPKAAVKK